MITRQTVFILGAGASAPYGYPTGAGLKKLICYETTKLLDQLIPITDGVIGSSWEEDQVDTIKEHTVEFVEKFSQAPGDFIDRFLENNSKVPFIPETGRALIALSILLSEKNSKFIRDENGEDIPSDWYKDLFIWMTEKLRGPDAYLGFKENKVDFITFNYDRSLEFFLYNSLIQTYGSIDLRTHKPLDLIPFKFIHVYGKIDNFSWEEPPGLDYRAEYHVRDILRASSNIKLIHERDDEFRHGIRDLILKAENIFFLGFGYDEDNMKALGWPKNFNKHRKIFGTAYKRSDDIDDLTKMMEEGFTKPIKFNQKPVIEDTDCRSLIKKYKKILYD